MPLKTCPICLGDVIVEEISQEGGRCTMCGYRLPVETRSSALARSYSPGAMTTARREGRATVATFAPPRPKIDF